MAANVVDLTLSSDESDNEVAVVVQPPAKKAKCSVKAESNEWKCQVMAHHHTYLVVASNS